VPVQRLLFLPLGSCVGLALGLCPSKLQTSRGSVLFRLLARDIFPVTTQIYDFRHGYSFADRFPGAVIRINVSPRYPISSEVAFAGLATHAKPAARGSFQLHYAALMDALSERLPA